VQVQRDGQDGSDVHGGGCVQIFRPAVFGADVGDVDDGALPQRREAGTVAISVLELIEFPGTPVAAGESGRFLVPDDR
jgi:hypothetical protein